MDDGVSEREDNGVGEGEREDGMREGGGDDRVKD